MVGVLALQGDVREHACGLARAGEPFRAVKSPEHLAGLDGIILPGGESTALRRLIASSGLTAPLANLLARGLPVWGTCAGVILLCRGGVWPVIDATLQRNAYGPQLASSVRRCLTVLSEHPFPMVFIRAPRLIRVGPDVEVLARLDGTVVACRQGNTLLTTFHPELTLDTLFVDVFLKKVRASRLGP